MFLTVKPPNGFVQSYDLSAWQAWSLELAVVRTGSGAAPTIGIAMALRGPMNGAPLVVPLVVLDLRKSEEASPEVRHITSIQFGTTDKRARLTEFLGVLNNNEAYRPADVEAITTGAASLIDAADAFMNGLWSFGAGLADLGPVASGKYLGWNWAVTRTRFEPLFFINAGPLGIAQVTAPEPAAAEPGSENPPGPTGAPPEDGTKPNNKKKNKS